METDIEKLENLGYDSFFESKRMASLLPDLLPARVTSEFRGAYKVKTEKSEFFSKITGKQMFEAKRREDYPAVGDFVLIEEADKENAVIKKILERKTIIKRRFGDKNKEGEKGEVQIIATNIDVGFVIESVDRDYNLNRFERYFSLLENGGVVPVIVLNKIDLVSECDLNKIFNEIKNRFPDVDILLTSTTESRGLDDIKHFLKKGKTYCFLGSSGVGKSSLVNKLLGEDVVKTGEISSYSERGKHTTTSRQMYFLDNGSIVIDNPGIREVGMLNTQEAIDSYFNEIVDLNKKCKYSDCTHTHEPGCAVLESVNLGLVDKDKYDNYTNLKKEAEYYDMTENEKKQKEKNFGKFINKAKKDFKRFGYENY